jgi:lipid A disaccharide synthetase
LPAVVVYRLASSRQAALSRWFLTAPHFASINLLAAREIVPEFCFAGEGPRARVEAALERAIADESWRAQCRAGLELAAERLGPPGATSRAARAVIATALKGSS